MDLTEDDISARDLLRKVLHTELPRSPVTRGANTVRRSMRIKNTPRLDSPGSALRNRLKKKLHESVSVSPLPSPKRRRSTVAKPDPPATAPSPLYDEDMTTRGLLRGIIQMETEASLLMSGQPAPQEPEENLSESSVSSTGEKTEGLSDLTLNTEPLTHVVRGLSRRKPQRAFNVSAFERHLDQLPENREDVSHVFHISDVPLEKSDASQDLDFSAGSKSGLNLTLKTPFVEKRTQRAGLQRKVSNRRVPSVDAFDEAVQRCLEQGPNQDPSEILDGKTLEESSWQKFTLGLNDVTELYVQMKKDDTMEPSAERESKNQVSENPDVLQSEHLIQEEKDHEMEPPSQEEEEAVSSSQEARDVLLSPEYDIVLAPTQAMTGSLEEFQDENNFEVVREEIVEGVEYENVIEIEDENEEVEDEGYEENLDAFHYQEKITRRAHLSEGGRTVLGIPATMRVTKSFGAGLNPREKDLLEFVAGDRGSFEDVPDEVGEQFAGSASPLYPAAEVTTSVQRSLQHEGCVAEEGHETPEQMSQTEEEQQMVESETASQSPEPLQEEEEEEIVESETANQSPEPLQEEEEEEEEEMMESETANEIPVPLQEEEEEEIVESETANQSPEPLQEEEEEEEMMESETANEIPVPLQEEEEEEIVESETANQSPEPLQEEEEEEEMMESETANESAVPLQEEKEEEMVEFETANHSPKPLQEEEEEIMDSVPANHSPEPSQEEEDDNDDDDTLSAELSMKTPAFIKQKRVFSSPTAQTLSTVLKEVNAGPSSQAAKRAPRQKRPTEVNVLPKSYVMSVFKHFAKTKVASDVYPVINDILKKYFGRLADDLEAYATHAKRKTIEVEDFELLMRRQGFVTDSTPVNILIEKYLPLEYRKLLIPVATSGNKVIPTQRR